MEIFIARILRKKPAMRKVYFLLVISFVIAAVSANAQTENQKPPPPPPPKIVKNVEVKEPPVVTVKGKMADEFYEKNPAVSEISRKGNVIKLKMKDGTTEKYDTSKKEEDKNFTDKYGRSPIPPPPPPKVKVKA
jgi:uncharacterized lipoprotein YajG